MTALHSTAAGEGLQQTGTAPRNARLLVTGFAILCLALVCLTARDGIADLFKRWRYEEEYEYGFLIAALVPLLLWRRWRAIVSEMGGPTWPGLAILTAAQLSTIVAALGESYFIEQIALVASMVGIGLVVFGTGPIRVLAPIALLLLLAIPLPYTMEAMLTIKLQLLSTNIGVLIIRLLGIPVYVEGNIIDLGAYKLQVAEACSGLRYLLPLACISFLVAYLYKADLWKKAVVVISAAPITILINSFRIAITAVLVNNFGTTMAEGFLHDFEGWVVFLIGVLCLVLEIFALERFRWSKVEIEPIISPAPAAKREAKPIKIGLSLTLALLLCVGAFGLTTSIASAYRLMQNPIRESFEGFPRQIGPWIGKPAQLEPDVLYKLKATDTFVGDFSKGRGSIPVNLFIAYYDSLSKGAAIHSPRVCLPGAGWEFASFEQREFGELEPATVGTYNRVVIQKGEQKMLMYYWYQQRKRRTANEFSMKYYLLVDSFFKYRKDGALVRLFTPISVTEGDKGLAEADARLRDFDHAIFSQLPSYLPE